MRYHLVLSERSYMRLMIRLLFILLLVAALNDFMPGYKGATFGREPYETTVEKHAAVIIENLPPYEIGLSRSRKSNAKDKGINTGKTLDKTVLV